MAETEENRINREKAKKGGETKESGRLQLEDHCLALSGAFETYHRNRS